MKTGAEALVDRFLVNNIKELYLYPGGTIAPILDAANKVGIELIRPRSEQGAGYMALAHSRYKNKATVLLATSGPGATNMVTPIADAFYDSLPLVFIAGQIGTQDLNKSKTLRQRGFQECDTISIFKSITKAQFQPQTPDDLPMAFEEAIKIAEDGRKGPVVIDVPMDTQRLNVTKEPEHSRNNDAKDFTNNQTSEIEKCLRFFKESKKPLLICGAGVYASNSVPLIRELIKIFPMACSASLPALGVVPSDYDYNLGFHGHTGFQSAGVAIQEADLVFVVGSRLDVRQTGTLTDNFAPSAKIIRIEIDPEEITHSRIRSDLYIRNSIDDVLNQLNKKLNTIQLKDLSDWHKRILEIKKTYSLDQQILSEKLNAQKIIKIISDKTMTDEVLCVTGVGSHQHWTARHFNFNYPKRQWFSSCGHGTMGFDLPTAAGLARLEPNKRTICFVGDGSFYMNLQELDTISRLQSKILIVVLDNQRLGIVGQFQKFNWDDDLTCGIFPNSDFSKISEAFGIVSFSIRKNNEIDEVIEKALNINGPALVHCIIDPNEDIDPMLLAGQALDKMWSKNQ